MKLIVDIPENIYTAITTEHLRKYPKFDYYDMCIMSDKVRNGVPLEKELEDIKAEIKTNCDEWIKGQDAEWHTYDRCLYIIDNHISELKGENK